MFPFSIISPASTYLNGEKYFRNSNLSDNCAITLKKYVTKTIPKEMENIVLLLLIIMDIKKVSVAKVK
jgi:hypothetical protein